MIENFDEKVRLVIGGLMANPKADALTKSVFTAYDPSKDRANNRTVLGGSRFQVPTLDACASFLKIATVDESSRIYSNKPALAMRIILEIETLFLTICGQCDEEYCNKFDSPTSPILRCFLCFQGSHSCEQTTQAAANLHAAPTALPHGTVWLCKLCLIQNNPVPNKRSKSSVSNRHRYPSTASVAVSAHTSQTATPTENKQPGISADELSKKLDVVHQEQQQQTANNPSEDDKICVDYTMGKCPHGISGRTLHQGETCSKLHPKRCKKFTRFGTDSSGGCTLGSGCQLYHPKHCKNSVQHKQCFKEQCTLVHLVGTKRVKPSKDNRKKDGKYPSGESRPDRGSYRRTESTSAANKPSQRKTGNSQHSTSFLEIQNLLKVMQATFQSEIISLKNQIAGQESKFNSFFPTANQTPHAQMFPHPLPTVSQIAHTPTIPHLPPALQHLNPTAVPQWARFHQHSC